MDMMNRACLPGIRLTLTQEFVGDIAVLATFHGHEYRSVRLGMNALQSA